MTNLNFVDVNNPTVLHYKTLLLKITDDENIVKVPAGYAANFGNVQLALTRHAFSLSLDGRVVLEEKCGVLKNRDEETLIRLGANRIVEVRLDPRDLQLDKVDKKFNDVVRVGNDGCVVGGLLSILIFINNVKSQSTLHTDVRSITFCVPRREVFTEFYINTVVRKEGYRYFMVDSNHVIRNFIAGRIGLTSNRRHAINLESLLRSPRLIDAESMKNNSAYDSMFDPAFCVGIRDMEIRGTEITKQIKQVDVLRGISTPSNSDLIFEQGLETL